MTKIIYIPLDERPVNWEFPQTILATIPELELVTPPLSLLGRKKTPAPLGELWAWLEEQLPSAQYLVTSLDQLLFGGIVPSRLHHYNQAECQMRLEHLANLKHKYPNLKIFAFNLIMRVPAYNSSDEEPDYYEHHGEKIYRWGWLTDLLGRGQGGSEEEEQLAQIVESIPHEVRTDYLSRRSINHFVNTEAISLVEQGVIDFLVIPLDDCAEYGFSAAEQRDLLKLVEDKDLHEQVHIYPGADEIGCTLVTRIYNQVQNRTPRVFVRYSSTMGPQIIPRYEDRPLGESIKSQITVCGGIVVDNSLEADLVLMVNSPTLSGRKMQEASDAVVRKDTSYYSFRNLREFVVSMEYYLATDRHVALADVAFGNGSDHELMQILAKQGILGELISYGAWNTPGNTIGTVLAHALIRLDNYERSVKGPDKFILDRYVEDWGYQVLVRAYLKEQAQELGITYFDLKDQGTEISRLALTELQKFMSTYLAQYTQDYELAAVYFPWNRLFEIGLTSRLFKR